jgi:hypothetical protein
VKMPDRQQAGETPRVRTLDDRQSQQQRRLQNRDQPANHERHAIEIGDLRGGEVERAAQNSGKNKHPRHAENILQPQDQQLIVGQPCVDADVENFFAR